MGLYTGLRWAETDRILVLACDMPFVRPQVLRFLTTVAPQADVVVPRINGYLEPLLAVYSKACLKPIETMIKRSEKCVYDFFPDVRVREVHQKEIEVLDPGLHSFVNINTPQDLETVTGSNDFFRSEFAGNG
jgi:molybdopterin-guanine dinucleotide biosynthesis protein A